MYERGGFESGRSQFTQKPSRPQIKKLFPSESIELTVEPKRGGEAGVKRRHIMSTHIIQRGFAHGRGDALTSHIKSFFMRY